MRALSLGILIVASSIATLFSIQTLLFTQNCIRGQDEGALSWEEVLRGPLDQQDERLLRYIRRRVLRQPAPPSVLYNLSQEEPRDRSMGQTPLVLRALGQLRNGFFVESGAWDGETRSNSLILERDFGWEGLLVEADPRNFQLLEKKGRKAWSANVCLAIKPFPHQVMFGQDEGRGMILEKLEGAWGKKAVELQCFPIFSLLTALNVTHVDYLSLDVEGAELGVLNTIPFDVIHIRTLSVEYVHNPLGRRGLHRWLTSKGFSVFGEVTHPNNLANDWIFVNNKDIALRNKILL